MWKKNNKILSKYIKVIGRYKAFKAVALNMNENEIQDNKWSKLI